MKLQTYNRLIYDQYIPPSYVFPYKTIINSKVQYVTSPAVHRS